MGADLSVERLRRAAFVRRARWRARRAGATLEIAVAPDARVGRGVRLELAPGTTNRLRIGARVNLRDGVVIRLDDGTIDIGGWCDIRDGVYLNVSGELSLGEACILSWGTVVHCSGRTVLGDLVGASDHVAIVDSSHYHSAPDVPFHDNLKRGEVVIGRNTWLGTKATVLRGSRIGAWCIVGANAVVSGEVPDGHAATGNPATLTDRRLAWVDEAGA